MSHRGIAYKVNLQGAARNAGKCMSNIWQTALAGHDCISHCTFQGSAGNNRLCNLLVQLYYRLQNEQKKEWKAKSRCAPPCPVHEARQKIDTSHL